ncbi:MAG: S1C family serine protease [Dehalococcoidia bacterium]
MKKLLAVPAAAIVLLGAVACTNDTNDSPSNTDTAAASAQTSALQTQNSTRSLNDAADSNDVVKAVWPSVVRIRANGTQTSAFGTAQQGEGTGTGFIVDQRGYIVTNNHVVTLGTNREASRFQVDLSDGRTVEGTLVGRDERTDLAVIKIEADNLTPVRFADSTKEEIGEDVLAIGFALDLGSTPTVTKGVISAKDRVINETLNAGGRAYPISISGAIQTDAAINPGNSGGPLVNMQGEVVGINTAGLVGDAGQPVQGIFFAVSSQVAEPIVESLIDNGQVERGYLGVEVTTVSPQAARAEGQGDVEGAGIRSVTGGSAADRAGLRAGDVITKIGDHEINNIGDVSNALASHKPGEKVKVEYARNGSNGSTDVTLGERPAGTT